MQKNSWEPGETAYFEYHCWQSPNSVDAQLWYRSQQEVTVLCPPEGDALECPDLNIFEDRAEACMLLSYKVRFTDGFEGTAIEDELLVDPRYFDPQFAPPKMNTTTVSKGMSNGHG